MNEEKERELELVEELSRLKREFAEVKEDYADLKIASGKADKEYYNLCRSYNIRGKVISVLTERVLELERELNAVSEKKDIHS